MKNIEISGKQKEMLLEMCKELFPEYTIYSADNDGFIEGEQWVGDQNMGEDRPVNEFNIHWFEFCMTHLIRKIDTLYSEKILNPLEDKARKEGYPNNWLEIWNDRPWLKLWSLTNSGDYKKHPIDYLYEEFKKLK